MAKSFDSKQFPIIIFETDDGIIVNDILNGQICGSISFEAGFKIMGLVPNYRNENALESEESSSRSINIIGITNQSSVRVLCL
jgi:hypothetical protein